MTCEFPVLTSLRKAADHCGASHQSVRNWIDNTDCGWFDPDSGSWCVSVISLDYLMCVRSWAYAGRRL